MPLDNLDAPLRLTWDLCPKGRDRLSLNDLNKVAERLIDAGIFYLSLEEQPLLHQELPDLLSELAICGCQISLIIGDDPAEFQRLNQLKTTVSLFVDARFWLSKPKGFQQLEAFFTRLRTAGHAPALLWVPRSGQLNQLFSLLALCERLEITRFKLPNPKIDATSEPTDTAGLLQPDDIDRLRFLLEKNPYVAKKTALEIHDLFLWELLFPQGGGERSEYGGCQAANSLGHITVTADLWPCSSWPQELGNLLHDDLLTLWDSANRHQVRAMVANPPPDCAGCADYSTCFGGCRGLALSCRTDDDRRDLLCRGPRNSNHNSVG